MRHFYTVVLERMQKYDTGFETEPYETGWASEAMFFIRTHAISGRNVALDSQVQVSADGINWINEGTEFPTIREVGDHFVKVSHFGGWLRITCHLTGEQPEAEITVQLVLKE